MKRYDELTHDELIMLSPEQVEKLIQLEIAEEGIKFVPEPTTPPKSQVDIQKSVVAYSVGGLLFENKADADNVALMPLLHEQSDWRIGYAYNYAEKMENVAVEVKTYFTHDDLIRVRDELQTQETERRRYEHDREAWVKYKNETSDIRKRVLGAVEAAGDWEASVVNGTAAYQKYLDMADGNSDIAAIFFLDAHWNEEGLCERVLVMDKEKLDGLKAQVIAKRDARQKAQKEGGK